MFLGSSSLSSQAAARSEDAEKLAAALAELPDDQRTAVILKHFQDWSLAQIAEEMGRSTLAVAGGRLSDVVLRCRHGGASYPNSSEILAHECGHTWQASRLGAIYLPVVGATTLFLEGPNPWNHFENEPLGAVFLVRQKGSQEVRAFNVLCPHLGCPVSWVARNDVFGCPCHRSVFNLEGQVISGVSPRGLDSLECLTKNDSGVPEIWVRFENFRTKTKEKIPLT